MKRLSAGVRGNKGGPEAQNKFEKMKARANLMQKAAEWSKQREDIKNVDWKKTELFEAIKKSSTTNEFSLG